MNELNRMIYRDLELELTEMRDDGSFRVRVLGRAPDGGELRADQAETATYRRDEFRLLVGKLDRRTATQSELMLLGERLAGLLLPGRVREMYVSSLNHVRAKGEGLRVRLRIEPPKLAALPWEYALVRRAAGEIVPTDFLVLQPDVSVTRYEAIGAALDPPVPKEKYRAVIALANPVIENQPPLDIDADREAIEAAIAALNNQAGVIEPVVVQPATRHALLDALNEGDIFHFSGHGEFESTVLGQGRGLRRKGRIILEKPDGDEDPYDSELLANALKASDVRLVVLGACNTASRDEGGAWSGVAPALVHENVPAVVAMQFDVDDTRAPVFISQLYLRVLQGYPIDQAVYQGRRLLFGQTGQTNGDWAKDRDWGTPVLYLRSPDGVLFPEPTMESEQAMQAGATPVVMASQRIKRLRGEAVVARVNEVLSGRLVGKQVLKHVEQGAKATVLEIDSLGGPGRRRRQ